MKMLHAIVDFYGEPYEDTCLCDDHYLQQNIDWCELSYGVKSKWREFEPELNNSEYATLTCTICGFPVGSDKE